METRKIQKVGGGTYTVSVPKEWARREGMETGETVRLYTHRDGSLIVRGSRTDGAALESVTVPLTDGGVGDIEQTIRAAYETGFERIKLVDDTSFTDEQRAVARNTTRRLVGTDLQDIDAGTIVVRMLLDASAVSIRQSIEQAASIVSTMLRTIREGLGTDGSIPERVRDRKPDVQRLVALITRHHNRSLVSFADLDALGIERVRLSLYERTANRLEELATAIVSLADVIDESTLSERRRRAVTAQIETLHSAFEDAIRLVFDAGADSTVDGSPRSREDPSGSTTDTARSRDVMDGSGTRLRDHVQRVEDSVRAIERIGLQSNVYSAQSVS